MILAGEEEVGVRQVLLPQGVDDLLSLGRRDDAIFGALEDQYGTRDAVNEVQR